jgi:large subunit ribosomal protein L1
MPNPKTGTVTMDVAKLQRLKLVKSILKLIKLVSYMQELVGFFGAEQIVDNAHEIIQTLIKLKPTAKGVYQKYHLTSTMSPAIALDPKAV